MTGPSPVTRDELAGIIDHTRLDAEAGPEDVLALCQEALELGVFAVCVSPTMVPLAVTELTGTPVRVATVVGFPSGAHPSEVKAVEAQLAVADGAEELGMVINLGLARAGAWELVRDGIAVVRAAAPDVVLKVIVETALLTREEIAAACHAADVAGAQFVETSTGFHRAGGASVEAVRLMAETVDGRLGVKASGGVHTAQAALALVAAGATRLGTARPRDVLDELEA